MNRRSIQRRRRGAVLIVILLCLAVAAALMVVVMRQIAAERQVVQLNYRKMQAAWLVEAGVERAVARLAAHPDYTGETWTISPKELAGEDGALVRIRVAAVADRPQQRSVCVEADYPSVPERRCRHMKQIVVDRDVVVTR